MYRVAAAEKSELARKRDKERKEGKKGQRDGVEARNRMRKRGREEEEEKEKEGDGDEDIPSRHAAHAKDRYNNVKGQAVVRTAWNRLEKTISTGIRRRLQTIPFCLYIILTHY